MTKISIGLLVFLCVNCFSQSSPDQFKLKFIINNEEVSIENKLKVFFVIIDSSYTQVSTLVLRKGIFNLPGCLPNAKAFYVFKYYNTLFSFPYYPLSQEKGGMTLFYYTNKKKVSKDQIYALDPKARQFAILSDGYYNENLSILRPKKSSRQLKQLLNLFDNED